MATPMRMKDKKMNKVHLGASGAMEISTIKAELSSASNGTAAQPANPMTPAETKATNPNPAPPAALGEAQAAPVTIEEAKDPNAQKETTTVAPNTGSGTIVGETETK